MIINLSSLLKQSNRYRVGYIESIVSTGKKLDDNRYELTDEQSRRFTSQYRIPKSSIQSASVSTLPSKWDMLKNLVVAAKDAIASGLDVRSPEDTEKALKICAECPNLAGDEVHPRCGLCGCHLAYKVKLTSWKCPIGKW